MVLQKGVGASRSQRIASAHYDSANLLTGWQVARPKGEVLIQRGYEIGAPATASESDSTAESGEEGATELEAEGSSQAADSGEEAEGSVEADPDSGQTEGQPERPAEPTESPR